MLQIASGKLFKQSPGQQNELRGIIHTNVRLLRSDAIETDAGRLVPTDIVSPLNGQLVYEFNELIEQSPAAGVVASHGIEPYIYDFSAILSLVLNATCTVDPEMASRLIGGKRGTKVHFPPKEFIPRVFDPEIWCREKDGELLIEIVSDLIGLRRKSFLASMRAIRTYVVGMHRIADDLELAYVLLVASMESLAHDFDDFQPLWDDYNEEKKGKIDDALLDADKDTADKVRTALLEVEQHSLAKRFREFTIAHVPPTYFRKDAVGIVNPASRADLHGALREAYHLRSRYVHSLQELPRQLRMATFIGETIRVEGKTHLTLRGIARLARHVIIEFIRRQPKVKTENYDYSRERAGIMQMPLAPEYWVGNAENVNPASGRRRLEGFLQQLTACMMQENDAVITDLHDLLRKVEGMLSTMSEGSRRPFLALYFLYDSVLPINRKMPNAEMIDERYKSELESPSIESMVTHLLLGAHIDWPIETHRGIHEAYFSQREQKSGLKIPRSLEAGICLVLAERHRAMGDLEVARDCIRKAVENCPGREKLVVLEEEFCPVKELEWQRIMLPSTEEGDGEESET